MEVEWEDPPELAVAKGRRSSPYLEFALVLKDNPGRWAVLPNNGPERTPKGAAGTAQNIRRGVTKGFEPKGSFETAVQDAKVWVRFNPPPEDQVEAPAPEPEERSDEDEDDNEDHGREVPSAGAVRNGGPAGPAAPVRPRTRQVTGGNDGLSGAYLLP